MLQPYAKVPIEFPPVPKNTSKDKVRYMDVPARNGNVGTVRKPYTAEALADSLLIRKLQDALGQRHRKDFRSSLYTYNDGR